MPSWQEATVDLTKYLGQSFYVYFNAVNDANSTRTWMFLDDVRLFVCYTAEAATPTATPIPPIVDSPTLTATGVVVLPDTPVEADVAAAQGQETPSPPEIFSGIATPEASTVIAEPRTTVAPPTASASPLWASLLAFLSRYRALIFGGLLVLVLIAIFALRR